MILLGNTFPLSLIRRPVRIEPAALDELKRRLQAEGFVSFWGHDNTAAAAQSLLGVDPRPGEGQRPAIVLTPDALPSLDGQAFHEVWVLSPDYAPGFRPQIGHEVPLEAIVAWQVLRITIVQAQDAAGTEPECGTQ